MRSPRPCLRIAVPVRKPRAKSRSCRRSSFNGLSATTGESLVPDRGLGHCVPGTEPEGSANRPQAALLSAALQPDQHSRVHPRLDRPVQEEAEDDQDRIAVGYVVPRRHALAVLEAEPERSSRISCPGRTGPVRPTARPESRPRKVEVTLSDVERCRGRWVYSEANWYTVAKGHETYGPFRFPCNGRIWR